jgi:tetratricopeptide (TPR) repeat protein
MDNPERFDTYLKNGDIYYHQCDNANALIQYQMAYALAPDSLSTLLRMVRTYNDIGRLKLGVDTSAHTYYQKAVDFAEIMVRIHPNRAESHFWLALGHGSLIPFRSAGDKIRIGKQVQDEARKAIELDSTFSYAYVILAIFQREGARLSWIEKAYVRIVFGQSISGSLDQAENYLLSALKYNPSNAYAFYELYWTYMAMGRNDKARSAIRSLTAIPPTNARERQQRVEGLEILRKEETTRSE